MRQLRAIIRILGILLFLEGIMLLACLIFSLSYGDSARGAFLISLAITLGAALLMYFQGNRLTAISLSRKQGYLLVTLSWLILCGFSALPFIAGGYTPSLADAFFEAVSGITSTGATIIEEVERLPESLLVWRSLTQWVGGLGVIVFTIAVLPSLGTKGLQMFAAEASNLTPSRVMPRVGTTARRILTIYIGLTLMLGLMLHWGGMSGLDSLCHALSTTSTGGFSTRTQSIAYYASPFIEYVTILFMFISGINFNLLILAFDSRFRRFVSDEEFRWFLYGIILFTAVVAVLLFRTSSLDAEESFRRALFQVVSLSTSTGLSSDNMVWIPAVSCLLTILMVIGGSAGSTTGGLKYIRLMVMAKAARSEFKHILHPSAWLPVRLSGHSAPQTLVQSILAFCFFYFLILIASSIALSALGSTLGQSVACSISALGNMGPVMGSMDSQVVWSHLPTASKYIMMALMILGRLEIFAVLVLFTPDFWKKA